jgi:hypothetical protein
MGSLLGLLSVAVFVDGWLALALWIVLGIPSVLVGQRYGKGLRKNQPFINTILLAGYVLYGFIWSSAYLYDWLEANWNSVKYGLRHVAWVILLCGELVFGLTTGYWGFSAVLWYISGLAIIQLVKNNWSGSLAERELKTVDKLLMLLSVFVFGTFGLAMLNMAGGLSLRSVLKPQDPS